MSPAGASPSKVDEATETGAGVIMDGNEILATAVPQRKTSKGRSQSTSPPPQHRNQLEHSDTDAPRSPHQLAGETMKAERSVSLTCGDAEALVSDSE